MKSNNKNGIFVVAFSLILLFACKRDAYYMDGGLSAQSEEEKKMTTYDFLVSRAGHPFDSLTKIVDITGTKDIINQANITLFAMQNSAVEIFQKHYNPNDKGPARPLSLIGIDTLKMLLNRLIIPNNKITLDIAVKDGIKYYKDNNGDSVLIYGTSGILPGSLVRTGADYLEFEHRKIPGKDVVDYKIKMQTHNLITANAIIHVTLRSSTFATGFKTKYLW